MTIDTRRETRILIEQVSSYAVRALCLMRRVLRLADVDAERAEVAAAAELRPSFEKVANELHTLVQQIPIHQVEDSISVDLERFLKKCFVVASRLHLLDRVRVGERADEFEQLLASVRPRFEAVLDEIEQINEVLASEAPSIVAAERALIESISIPEALEQDSKRWT